MTRDEEHLNLLSIFHYVAGGLTALFASLCLLHIGVGIAVVNGTIFNTGNDAMPAPFGWLFIVMGGVFLLLGWTIAGVMLAAGKKLKQRVSHTFCMVVAGIECTMMPFGTVLGVFTIIVLARESVKALFAANVSGGRGC